MSFSFASILWAALAGAVGGAIGGALSQIIRISNQKMQGNLRTVVVVTFVVLSYNLAQLVPPPFSDNSKVDEAIAELLEGETVFAYILEDQPQLRSPSKERLRAAYAKNGNTGIVNEAAILGAELGGKYLVGYIPKASDASILTFSESFLGQLNYLARTDSELCFHWMFGGAPDLGSRLNFAAEMTARSNEAMIAVISSSRSTTSDPVLLSDEEFQSKLGLIADLIVQKYPADDISFEAIASPNLVASFDDKRAACLTAQALYQEIYDTGEKESVPLLRTIFAAAGGAE